MLSGKMENHWSFQKRVHYIRSLKATFGRLAGSEHEDISTLWRWWVASGLRILVPPSSWLLHARKRGVRYFRSPYTSRFRRLSVMYWCLLWWAEQYMSRISRAYWVIEAKLYRAQDTIIIVNKLGQISNHYVIGQLNDRMPWGTLRTMYHKPIMTYFVGK